MSLVGNSGTFYIYAFGLFLNWRRLAMVASLSAIPYVLGMIFVLPDDYPYERYDISKKHKRLQNVSLRLTELFSSAWKTNESFNVICSNFLINHPHQKTFQSWIKLKP